MAALPERQHSTPAAIYALHERRAAAEEQRPYLGWSEIGHPCERYLWQRWRWCEKEVIEGRIARLFDTGHREEDRVLAELRAAGMEVWDRDASGQQFGIASIGGHLRGHIDAVVAGLPEAPKTPHLVDVKTVNTKRFKEIAKKSMKNVYPKYWAQAHGYMGHMDLQKAMFIFVCKDDDQIHVERFDFDKSVLAFYEQRAERIVRAAEPPPRIADDRDDDECKYCAFKELCHGTEAPAVNCRTCVYSTPALEGDSGSWRCERHDNIQATCKGCDDHLYIPPLLANFATPIDSTQDSVRYRLANGTEFVNGPPPGFRSIEIRAVHDKVMLGDETMQHIKRTVPSARAIA